jgi:hypothetical protein
MEKDLLISIVSYLLYIDVYNFRDDKDVRVCILQIFKGYLQVTAQFGFFQQYKSQVCSGTLFFHEIAIFCYRLSNIWNYR